MHRVGRTGRAGRKGTAYTFISVEEEMHAPTLIKALTQSKQKVRVMTMLDNVEWRLRTYVAILLNLVVWAHFSVLFPVPLMAEVKRFSPASEGLYFIAFGSILPRCLRSW